MEAWAEFKVQTKSDFSILTKLCDGHSKTVQETELIYCTCGSSLVQFSCHI